MARLIPFIVFLYVFNYLDRVNVSFAKLTMCEDLGFSEKVYGFGPVFSSSPISCSRCPATW